MEASTKVFPDRLRWALGLLGVGSRAIGHLGILAFEHSKEVKNAKKVYKVYLLNTHLLGRFKTFECRASQSSKPLLFAQIFKILDDEIFSKAIFPTHLR